MKPHADVDLEPGILSVLFVPLGASLNGFFMLSEAIFQSLNPPQEVLLLLVVSVLSGSDGDHQKVVDMVSISDMNGAVIWAGDSSHDLLTEVCVLEGMNVSGVSTMLWNELVELECSVRPRTK